MNFAVGVSLSLSGQAQSPVLIKVDLSNPAAATFTATGEKPTDNDNLCSIEYGVTLVGFFTGQPGLLLGEQVGGDLKPNQVGVAYDYWVDNSFGGTGGLNLYRFYYEPEGAPKQIFVTSDPAFSGSALIDLSGYSGFLPQRGTRGAIRVGDGTGYAGREIGYYEIIPEPSAIAWALMGPAGALFVILRRRLSKR